MVTLAADAPPGPPWWLTLILVVLPAAASIAGAVVAGRYAAASRANEQEAQRLRDLEQRISERKYDIYKPMIALLGDMLNKEKAAKAAQAIPARLHEFATWISIYGSDDSVRAYRNFMQASFAGAPVEIFMRLYCELVLAARRDIGHPDTRTSPEEILALRVNDLYQKGEFRSAVTEPFDQLCRRVGWSPPWLATAD
jgi:hypothetical protein